MAAILDVAQGHQTILEEDHPRSIQVWEEDQIVKR
jgi:hypothetical protein